MLRKTISIILVIFQLIVWVPPTHAEYESIYHYYIEEGIEAFYKMDFESAYFYFKTAHAIDPSRERPLQYINLIKRQQEGRLESAVPKPKGNDLFEANLSGPTPTEKMRSELAAEILPEVLKIIFKENQADITDRMIEDAVKTVSAQVRNDAAKNISDEIWDDIVRQATVDVILHVEKFLARQRALAANALTGQTAILEPSQNIAAPGTQIPATKKAGTTENIEMVTMQPSQGMPVAVPSETSQLGRKLIEPVSSVEQKAIVEKNAIPIPPIERNTTAQSIESMIPAAVQPSFPMRTKEERSVFPRIEKIEIPVTETKPTQIEQSKPLVLKSVQHPQDVMDHAKLEFQNEKVDIVPKAEGIEQKESKLTPTAEKTQTPDNLNNMPQEAVSISDAQKAPKSPLAKGETPISRAAMTENSLPQSELTPQPTESTPQENIPDEVKYIPNAPLIKQSELKPAFVPVGVKANLMQLRDGQELKLDDALWSQMANLILELKVGESVILVGKNIQRFLSVTEGILEIKRINADRIKVTGLKRGNSILYIWDIKGRWTLNIHCVYTFASEMAMMRKLKEQDAKPFRLEYSSNWSTLHQGPSLGKMTRQNLIFTNWAGIFGDTPYGQFDASADTYQFPASTEVVGETIGLTNAHIGPFDDFSIRGYDASKSLSDLTLQGRYFRGILLDSYAFHHKLSYSYFRGQDQSISIFVGSQSNVQTKKSYVEGTKITLNPDEPTKYSFNYVRGWGSARQPDFVKDVFSGQVQHVQKGLDVIGEVATDRERYAATVFSNFERNDLRLNVNFRDIQKRYQTIYGLAGGAGQIGTAVTYEWKPRDMNISGYFDLYNDQSLPNPDNPNGVNFDSNTSFNRQVDRLTNWGVSFSYTNDSQLISPRQSAQLGASYSKTFEFASLKSVTFYSSPNFQWSRYKDVPDADFDRFNLRSGFRANLIKSLSYFFTYDYIWVRDVARDRLSNPWTIDTGFYFSHKLTEKMYFSSDITYHKEKSSSSVFSFLAGEDSVSNNLSLTYRPFSDMQIYLDSQLRRVYPENRNVSAFDEWNLMLGMKAGWDLPFKWNPTGSVRGIVYKDYNGNGLQDKGEPGLAGIKVVAGHWETYTNENGEYLVKVHSKQVAVSLDLQTIPQGFVFSTALSRDVMIQNDKAIVVNFGLTARSGIYGVAYYDLNGDGVPTRGDKFINNVVIRLDSDEITKTDPTGSYFFENIKPGKHKVRLDVKSIPKDYLPTVKIENEVEVKEGITYVYNIPLKKITP